MPANPTAHDNTEVLTLLDFQLAADGHFLSSLSPTIRTALRREKALHLHDIIQHFLEAPRYGE